ncbi:MAG: hypothetical protein A2018_02480 [Alphaproteobacteria bacterium GWF2_58_20]|nr:MAG: hypothetical protein A2018_02480 [Alphaproteobacteria bacterium GWF2_58_20]
MKHKIFVGLAIFVALLVVGGIFLYGSIDSVVAAAIRGYGPKITGVPVAIESVKVTPTEGRAVLRGLVVGNPDGFETPHAFSLGEIRMVLDVKSLGSDVVHIQEIVIDNPEITYEYGVSGSNIDAIRAHVASLSSGKASTGSGDTSPKGEGAKLIIDSLVISGGKIDVSAAMLKGKTLRVPLPDIHLSDIGKKSEGASAAEVVSKVMSAVSSGVSGAVSKLDLGALSKKIQESSGATAEDVKKSADDAVKRLKGMFQ